MEASRRRVDYLDSQAWWISIQFTYDSRWLAHKRKANLSLMCLDSSSLLCLHFWNHTALRFQLHMQFVPNDLKLHDDACKLDAWGKVALNFIAIPTIRRIILKPQPTDTLGNGFNSVFVKSAKLVLIAVYFAGWLKREYVLFAEIRFSNAILSSLYTFKTILSAYFLVVCYM